MAAVNAQSGSQKLATGRKSAPIVPDAVMEQLAKHTRQAGTSLLLLRPDGTLAWHDHGSGVLYERFLVPALKHTELLAKELRSLVSKMNAQSPIQTWEFVPGMILCAAPLVDRRQMVGVLILAGKCEKFSLDEDVLRVCSLIGLDSIWLGQQAANVMAHGADRLSMGMGLFVTMLSDRLKINGLEEELNSLSTQLANTYEELTLIDQISGGMRVNRSSGDFFRQACLELMQVISVRGMGVVLSNEKIKQDPVLYGELSLPPGQVQRLAEQLLGTLSQKSSTLRLSPEGKNCLLINDLKADKNYKWLAEHAQQLLAVPLQRREQILGCLFALDKANGTEFDSVDSKLVTSISNESAIYLENAILFGDVHGLMMGLLHSLTSAVDAKDAYTCGHSERVALLSRHLAGLAGRPDSEIERIYMAGLLHDVGKIGVPESVLQKTGKLTPEEFDQMKKHPEIGARILADVKQVEDIIPGVLYHHERYDGKGYPTGLAGKNIPLMGRIICLADCFDAMTSNRTYRKALPLEVAL
ncbi:MAG TPA: HD-GYP domain-containing protein, partial [Tepidisphaeraceae bacterium]|nr:HD-GYP domain-containing protein [Tepidisphaeraceae bacterium]